MTVNQLKLRPIDELRSESFHVPAYQRGYRWTRRQVVELLQDVWDFARSGAKVKGEFYCLQPVVVAPYEDGAWEVVDGQQRLTTLSLILSFFNERLTEKHRRRIFPIDYRTRPASAGFLLDPKPERENENIDFFHMARAYAAILEWFEDKSSNVNEIESAFLNDVKIIWYEIGPETKPMEVFQRLNIGKIALTDAELVKALFLRSSNFEGEGTRLLQLRQLQIAHEWDSIERRLQEDDFWYFLTNMPQEANRIEFVLRLCADRIKQVEGAAGGEADIFHVFVQQLDKPDTNAWTQWAEVKRLFLSMEEWFRDDTLHHLVGFLASQETGEPHAAIARVARWAEEAPSKRAFRRRLKDEIFIRLFRGRGSATDRPADALRELLRSEISALDYVSDKAAIRNVLLLFNLATLIESHAYVRFPFGAFKTQQWDIEHIRSVQSRMPKRPDDQKRWLSNVVDYLGCEEGAPVQSVAMGDLSQRQFLREAARALQDAVKFDEQEFQNFFLKVQQLYDPDQDFEVDNGLGNLTLLDAATNRGYGNAIFPIKRSTIIALDKVGRFVPLCTKNVFLKYYSKSIDRMLVWGRVDAEAHAAAVCDRLSVFFAEEAGA
ncbi:DUF262 domain-containing protein [Variovorax boronicumulans]|uniref:DUF262 domain-containing protein n=1 Tax=Variovorax boronicumulans TaxID=436515 RepID=UPI00339B149E